MVNLLPLEEKKHAYRRYLMRVGIIALALFVVAVASGIVFLYPSFLVSVGNERGAVKRLLATQQTSFTEKNKASEEMARSINKKVATLRGKYGIVESRSAVIKAVVAMRPRDISISGFLYEENSEKKTARFVVSGIAGTRDSLLSFTETLKKDARFSSVNLPIESLIKNTDSPFSITIEFAKLPRGS